MNNFRLLREYLEFYIQMLAYKYSGDISFKTKHIPTFEEWKNGFGKNFTFRDSITISTNGKIMKNHGTGIDIEKGIAYRNYDYCLGRKYYEFGNIKGDFTIFGDFSNYDKQRLNAKLKEL